MKKLTVVTLPIILSLISCSTDTNLYSKPWSEIEKKDMNSYIASLSFEPIVKSCSKLNSRYSQLPAMLKRELDMNSVARGKELFDNGAQYEYQTSNGDGLITNGSLSSTNQYTQTMDKYYLRKYKHDAKLQINMLSSEQLEQVCATTLASMGG